MNIQEAIDIAVDEDRQVTFECLSDRDSILADIKDSKGCSLMKPTETSTEITIWPPSQCTYHQHQGEKLALPFCFSK